jgi:hypothetical protein
MSAIRFAPYVQIYTLSMTDTITRTGTFSPAEMLKARFSSMGLARSVSVDVSYGTQARAGIGFGADPMLIPGNPEVSVNIERLQLDKKTLRNYANNPEFWMSPVLQNLVHGPQYGNADLSYQDVSTADSAFNMFLFLDSIEDMQAEGRNLSGATLESLDNNDIQMLLGNRRVLELSVTSYSTSVDSGNVVVMSRVSAVGKFRGLQELLDFDMSTILGGG